MMKPCMVCGKPTEKARCRLHARLGPRQRGLDRDYDIARAETLARSRICHLCNHDGADQADHLIPVEQGGLSIPSNLKPAHGTKPCPTCGVRCNQVRGNKTRRL